MPEMRHVWGIQYRERGIHNNLYEVGFTVEDGRDYYHVFPEALPAHIAAAYSVDISADDAPDQILDIILHQHHIPEPLHQQNFQEDPAFKKGMKATVQRHLDLPEGTVAPVTLYTAESHEQAREAHMMRIAEVKKKVRYVPYTEVDIKNLRSFAAQVYHVTDLEKGEVPHPFSEFRSNLSVTEEHIKEHRAQIEVVRHRILGKEIPDDMPRGTLAARSRQKIERPTHKDPALVRRYMNVKYEPTWD